MWRNGLRPKKRDSLYRLQESFKLWSQRALPLGDLLRSNTSHSQVQRSGSSGQNNFKKGRRIYRCPNGHFRPRTYLYKMVRRKPIGISLEMQPLCCFTIKVIKFAPFTPPLFALFGISGLKTTITKLSTYQYLRFCISPRIKHLMLAD